MKCSRSLTIRYAIVLFTIFSFVIGTYVIVTTTTRSDTISSVATKTISSLLLTPSKSSQETNTATTVIPNTKTTKITMFEGPIKQEPPNILYIIMDDLGSNDLGIHGTGINTTNCDKLVSDEGGIYLSNYYVLPVCSPTRAAILSGRYPLRYGLNNHAMGTQGLPLDEETLPEILKNSGGYKTHAVGKWHVGASTWNHTPTFRGFNSFFGFYGGGQNYFTHSKNGQYDMHYDKHEFCGYDCSQIIDERGNYSTHVFTREAIRIINEHHNNDNNNNNKNKEDSYSPLFLYLSYQAVHSPMQVPEQYKEQYIIENRSDWNDNRITYAGMLTAADESIGYVIDSLKKNKMWDNTLVVFTTDNGGPTETCAVTATSNYPLRGGKCSIWQGGTTGDAFISGPALKKLSIIPREEEETEKEGKRTKTEKTTTNNKNLNLNENIRTFSDVFHAVDWLPTLSAIAGARPSGRKELDGINQLPALRGGPTIRNEVYIGITDKQIGLKGPALRYDKWKIIRGSTGGLPGGWPLYGTYNTTKSGIKDPRNNELNSTSYLLYNLHVDPNEHNDISSNVDPHILNMMINKLNKYWITRVAQQKIHGNCKKVNRTEQSNIVKGIGKVAMPGCENSKNFLYYETKKQQ